MLFHLANSWLFCFYFSNLTSVVMSRLARLNTIAFPKKKMNVKIRWNWSRVKYYLVQAEWREAGWEMLCGSRAGRESLPEERWGRTKWSEEKSEWAKSPFLFSPSTTAWLSSAKNTIHRCPVIFTLIHDAVTVFSSRPSSCAFYRKFLTKLFQPPITIPCT